MFFHSGLKKQLSVQPSHGPVWQTVIHLIPDTRPLALRNQAERVFHLPSRCRFPDDASTWLPFRNNVVPDEGLTLVLVEPSSAGPYSTPLVRERFAPTLLYFARVLFDRRDLWMLQVFLDEPPNPRRGTVDENALDEMARLQSPVSCQACLPSA